MLPKHVRYQAALHPARPGCRHRRWFCSRRRNISYYTCVHLSTLFFNFSEKTSLPFLLPSQRSLAPLTQGSCPASSRTEGCPMGAEIGGGLASPSPIFAPNQLFELLRCFAWLIQLRQRTALSPLKRSCFSRFAHPPNPAPSSRLFSISRRSGLMAPLCKGSCPASSRTEGLPPG